MKKFIVKVIFIKQDKFNVALYIRLSKEDFDKKESNEESYSIKNQRIFLRNYVKEKGYNIIQEYVDDGYTGTNFERPAFKKLIKDIEDKKINMVITKDLSRLGRDYIETGKYIEKYFPLKNVRYVSVLDNIDTFINSLECEITPFKAVINDMYSRDNSKKIKAALKTLKTNGKWVGGCIPLGYMQDSKDKNHLVINKDEAYIIEKIFNYALNGLSDYQIKEKLIEEKIPTFSLIRKINKNSNMALNGIWSSKTVHTILHNQIYVGDLVQNKKSRINYKIRKLVPNDKSEWIISLSSHEAIISKELFNEVERLRKIRRVKPNKTRYRIFDGLLYCGECNHRITICKPRKSNNKTYTVCNTYRMYSKQKLCTPHSNNYDILECEVINTIKSILNNKVDKVRFNNMLKKTYEAKNSVQKLKADDIDNLIQKKYEQIDNMYIDKINHKIEEEMYNRIKDKIEIEIKNLKTEKENIKERSNSAIKNCYDLNIENFFKFENSCRMFMLKLIKKIEIHQNKQIDVYFNFKKLS